MAHDEAETEARPVRGQGHDERARRRHREDAPEEECLDDHGKHFRQDRHERPVDVDVGRHARIRRAIIDKGVQIPEGARIGYDLDEDRRRGFTVSESGVVVLGKLDAFTD